MSDDVPCCEVCGGPFTPGEWEDRHTTEDGPVHAACCLECPTGVESVDVEFYDGSWRATIDRAGAPTLMFDGYDDLDGLLRAMAERIES